MGEIMVKEVGFMKYKRGQKQKDGGYTYIIGYTKKRKDIEVKEIRFTEMPYTDVTFREGDHITVKTSDDSITIINHTVPGTVTGTKV